MVEEITSGLNRFQGRGILAIARMSTVRTSYTTHTFRGTNNGRFPIFGTGSPLLHVRVRHNDRDGASLDSKHSATASSHRKDSAPCTAAIILE